MHSTWRLAMSYCLDILVWRPKWIFVASMSVVGCASPPIAPAPIDVLLDEPKPAVSAVPNASAPATPSSAVHAAAPPPEVVWGGVAFHKGDRVRIRSRAGTFKPAETHQAGEIEAGKGQTGTIVRGETRVEDAHFTPQPDEPTQLLRVAFEEQMWPDANDGHLVRVPAFEGTIHADYLEIIEP
jgi:hypothetical protein